MDVLNLMCDYAAMGKAVDRELVRLVQEEIERLKSAADNSTDDQLTGYDW